MPGSYYEIFMNQFVQTLAQLSAAALTTSVAVPLYNFYLRRKNNTYEEVQKEDQNLDQEENQENQETEENEADEEDNCSDNSSSED